MKHLKVLEKIKNEFQKDKNVIGFLVFGSVGKGTFHEDSDIDLFVVYKNFEKGYEFSNDFVDEIKIGFSRYSEEKLKHKVANVPYRMYVFAHAKILYDLVGIKEIQKHILEYFKTHPVIQKEWDIYNERYEDEKKKFGEGKTNIRIIYDELDKKWGKN